MLRILVAVAVLVAGLLLWRFSAEAPVANLPTPTSGGDAPAASAAGGLSADPEAQNAPERLAVNVAPSDPDVAAEEPTFVVRGRCVFGEDKQPVVGCELELAVTPTGAAAPAIAADAVTEADGRFELACRHDAWSDALHLVARADGFVTRAGSWAAPEIGRVVDLGDVHMLPAIRVAGEVVDREGAPVEGVELKLLNLGLEKHLTSAIDTQNTLRAQTDAAGRYAFEGVAYPGEWWIAAENTGPLVEPRTAQLVAGESEHALRIVVDRPDPATDIVGVAVDRAGRPVAGLELSVMGDGARGKGRSNEDGSFRIHRAAPIPERRDAKAGAAMTVLDPELRFECVEPGFDTRLVWGQKGVRVVMRERVGQQVQVVDAAGLAVEDYTLFAFVGRVGVRPEPRLTQRGRHENGMCALDRLAAGHYAVLALPRDAGVAASGLVRFEQLPEVEGAPVRVALAPPIETTVQVQDMEGRPMVGSEVQLLIALRDAPLDAATKVTELRNCGRSMRASHLCYATVHTDQDGRATLRSPGGEFYVRVRGEQHVASVGALTVHASASVHRVQVTRAGGVAGVIGPMEAVARLREVSRAGGKPVEIVLESEGLPSPDPVAVAEDGRYSIGALEAGEWSVSLRYWLRTSPVSANYVVLPLQTVALAAGQQEQVDADVAHLLPGTLRGTVRAAGKPLADVHCFLRRKEPGWPGMMRVGTNADGVFSGLVPAGTYGFSYTYPAQSGPGWFHIVLPDVWQLQPGGDREVRVDFPLRRIQLRLVDADGKPVSDVKVKVFGKGYSHPGGLRTDTVSGACELYPAPYGAFRVLVSLPASDKDVELGPVSLPGAQLEGTVEVRLPR
ncbi:MAG: carboxypeptidase-like regulatory domain-containing protein [Planctomycetota bacterium]